MRMNRFFLLTVLLSTAWGAAGYKVDQQIGKGELDSISQISIAPGDLLCALDRNGKITVFDTDGARVSSIETGMAKT